MAADEEKGDVIKIDHVDIRGETVFCVEAEQEYGEVDSGAESDETDLLELGDVGVEFCLVGDQTCSIPLELYDLPDLRDVLSLDVWNECLSEDDRLKLAKYLPDMDKATFMLTLKELLSGDDFHFGSPVNRLFEMMNGGLCEPRVALYRQGLNMLEKCKYYHQLRNYHNNMVSSIYQIRDVWISCRGHNIDEKLQKLKVIRSQISLMYEKMDGFGLDGGSSGRDDPDGDMWSHKLMETRLKKASHLDYQGTYRHLSRKHNPKALFKQAKLFSPARPPAAYSSSLGELGERSIVLECGDIGRYSAEAEYLVGNQNGLQSSAKRPRCKVFANDEHGNSYIASPGCSRSASKRKRMERYEFDLRKIPVLEQDMGETGTFSHELGTVDPPRSEVEITNVEMEAKAQKTGFNLITPTVHTELPFSVIHLLSSVRVIMTTPQSEDPLVDAKPLKDSVENDNHIIPEVHANVPALTIQEIVNRIRSNPGDPCILETEEPLQDLVRGVLRIISSKKAPLGAKDWKPLAAYRNSARSWYWIGPILQKYSSDQEITEEVTSPEAWGIPRKTLVKLVDSFANWLVSSQEVLKQLGSLPAPPESLFRLKMEEKDRFGDQRVQKSSCTFEPSSSEVREYFRREELLRYSLPDRAFAYTAADGSKSMVAPLKRCSGKTSKPRDHYLLQPDRPPHVTIRCLVRDAAARLPGCVGTRSDICTLLRDSQYIVEDVTDSQLNQVVSGALDRLHYGHDPCVRFENDRKIWVYLHRERVEEDFEDDGTSSSSSGKSKRQKDPSQPANITNGIDQDVETGLENTDEPATVINDEDTIVDIMSL